MADSTATTTKKPATVKKTSGKTESAVRGAGIPGSKTQVGNVTIVTR